MSRWFRFYECALDDPKVQLLPDSIYRTWTNLLCLASRHDGILPTVRHVAFSLRISEERAASDMEYLVQVGLLDYAEKGLQPHNWEKRQYRSDKDETAAERQRKKRERDNVTRDTSVTSRPPEADTEPESETKAEQPKQDAARCVSLGQQITDLMGVTNDPRWLGNWSIVSVWLAQGFDAELDILPTVTAMVDRMKRQNKAMPGSLKYFSRAIEENHKARLSSGVSPVQTPGKEFYTAKRGSKQALAWIAYYKAQGRSTKFIENQESFTVPSEYPPQEKAA